MYRLLRKARKDQNGVALIEFAIVLPVLLLLFLGAMEMTRYILVLMKVQKASYVLTDVITQYPSATAARTAGEINETELHNVMGRLQNLLGGRADQRMVIVSSIQRVAVGQPTIRWQQSSSPGDANTLMTDVTSEVTRAPPCGNCPALRNAAANFASTTVFDSMGAGENIIVGEVFYRYEPALSWLLGGRGFSFLDHTVSRTLYMFPRSGVAMACLPPTFVYAGEC